MKALINLGLFGITLTVLSMHMPLANAAPAWDSGLVAETPDESEPGVTAAALPQTPAIHEALGPIAPQVAQPLPDGRLPVAAGVPMTLSANPSFAEAINGHVQVVTFRRPKDFDYEFTILVVDGKIRRSFVVSTAIPGKTPILGIHRLTPLKQRGLPWPWITSSTYGNSPMYWGVNIRGGYYIHSSPHYGNLGKPASMGCTRTSLPDAMDVFNTVANEFADKPSYSMIYENMSITAPTPQLSYLKTVLTNSGMTMDDLKAALVKSKKEVAAISTGDLEFTHGVPADAHARPFTGMQSDERNFPRCGGSNCWDVFGKHRAIIQLSPTAMQATD